MLRQSRWIPAEGPTILTRVRRTAQLAILGLLAAGCGRSTIFECVVGVTPTSLDFGSSPFGTPVSRSLAVSSRLNNACFLSDVSLGAGSDPGFSVDTNNSFGVEPGTEMKISLTFKPVSVKEHVSGTLVFNTSDPGQPAFSIPLSATVRACDLTTPDGGLDFGTVTLGVASTQPLTLTNNGLATCDVTIALSSASAPGIFPPVVTANPGHHRSRGDRDRPGAIRNRRRRPAAGSHRRCDHHEQ